MFSKGAIMMAIGFVALSLLYYLDMFAVSEGLSLAMAVIATTDGGAVVGEPLTNQRTEEVSPDLIRPDIDSKIVKIKPYSTPLEQLSRLGKAYSCKSQKCQYYQVDTIPRETKLVTPYVAPTNATESARRATLKIENYQIVSASEVLRFKGVTGYDEKGAATPCEDFCAYVVKVADDGSVVIQAINGKTIGEVDNCVPSLVVDTKLYRLGRAAKETDVQTSPFQMLPKKTENFCQSFKMQVEQSTLNRMTDKEVDWSFTDLEEAAAFEFRSSIESQFLFGVKRLVSIDGSDVYLTGGIWGQAGKEYPYAQKITQETMNQISKAAFSGGGGESKQKVFFCGSDLIEEINNLDINRQIQVNETVTVLGIDFKKHVSKFGTLLIYHNESFDINGHKGDGLIIDLDNMKKRIFQPLCRTNLDLKGSGVRDVDAAVLTEISCLTLTHPKAHVRIVRAY